jgi:hypothetical protein
MPSPKTIFAITFLLFVSLSLIFPSFPPAQLLHEYLRIPQTTSSIWGITLATLLKGFTNGFFWVLVVATVYGVANYFGQLKPLPPMPVAPHLTTPPLENPHVDYRVNRIPPALTISLTPSFTARREPTNAVHHGHTAKRRNRVSWRHEVVNVRGASQERYRDLKTGRFIKKPGRLATSKSLQNDNLQFLSVYNVKQVLTIP